jgi:hypothetical protein
MKTTLKLASLLVVLATSAPVAMAQNAPAGLGTSNCAINRRERAATSVGVGRMSTRRSSRSTRKSKGFAVPCFHLFSKTDKLDFRLFGYNVSQDDQHYTGWFKTKSST